jgi:hypothetical protein
MEIVVEASPPTKSPLNPLAKFAGGRWHTQQHQQFKLEHEGLVTLSEQVLGRLCASILRQTLAEKRYGAQATPACVDSMCAQFPLRTSIHDKRTTAFFTRDPRPLL